jgi:hypothetical protein
MSVPRDYLYQKEGFLALCNAPQLIQTLKEK